MACGVWIRILFLGMLSSEILAAQLGLTPAETSRLEREKSIENRIRIYETASARLFRSVQSGIQRNESENLPEELNSWIKLLSASLEDIEEKVQRKKKSKALIRYEIQLRKAISDLQDLKVHAPLEHHDAFDSWLTRAEGVRKRFVDILFHR